MQVRVAYFSAEFGIAEALPIYSGGLGVLAGDHVKAANDLGMPLVGVGVLYRRGYFQQRIQPDGRQEALYPKLDPAELPVQPVSDTEGRPLVIQVPMGERPLYLKIWRADVGTVPVYLMDADLEQNQEPDRRLTDCLYGGDRETRIRHEMILGIGGVRVLRALGIDPDVWHMNEGHVAFLTLERIREYSAQGVPFAAAVEAVRANTIFTTHTPVPAGHDQFSMELIDRYLGDYYWQTGANREKILGLGRVGEQFNMTRFAMRTASKVNGVSQLHADVTRRMFHQWLPEIPPQEIPVEAVTNGVHTRSWLAPELVDLYDRHLAADWATRIEQPEIWERIFAIPELELWETHQLIKRRMWERLGLAGRVETPSAESVLTIGFARRFATYKRALLLFRDLPRLERIVNHPERSVRFLFAGKAHPADQAGQDLIRRIVEISQTESFRNKIIFLENYDLALAKQLVQGVDVWLNTPLKPMEASGTSGMKAALNGVLNCSVLDGWWQEGFNGQNGWAIEGVTSDNPSEQNRIDADTLYWLLEERIAPLYYQRATTGEAGPLPRAWVAMMKQSIRTLTPVFSTQRMVSEYRDRFYQPVAARGKRFTENHLETAARVAAFKQFIRKHWHQVEVQTIEVRPDAQGTFVQAKIHLAAIWHQDVKVEAVGSNGHGGIWTAPLQHVAELEPSVHLFEAVYPERLAVWFQSDANIRVLPVSPDFANEFEMELCKWGTRWR